MCGNCERREIPCVYSPAEQNPNGQGAAIDAQKIPIPDLLGMTTSLPWTLASLAESQILPHTDFNDISDLQLLESKSRRLLEFRLLNHYKDHLANPLQDHTKSHVVTGWSSQVPQMALEHDNVQYMMFCCATCHLLRSDPDNLELLNAQRLYLALAMREQQKAVAQLNLQNCDSVCYTAMLLLITAVARLWRRSLEPYMPPVEFLRLGHGAGALLQTAKAMFKDHKDAKTMLFINAPPVFYTTVIFSQENRIPFQRLLSHDIQFEPWNADIHEAYEKAVSYLGYLHNSIQDNDPIYVHGRKIISFSIFVPGKFIDLVEEWRPRALIILAYYFGFMARAKSLWWTVETAEKEIQAIQSVLPPEWQELMRWPLTMTGLAII